MEEAQVMMAGVRAEFVDPKLRLLTTFRYVWGRKPWPKDDSDAKSEGIQVCGLAELSAEENSP